MHLLVSEVYGIIMRSGKPSGLKGILIGCANFQLYDHLLYFSQCLSSNKRRYPSPLDYSLIYPIFYPGLFWSPARTSRAHSMSKHVSMNN